MFEGPEPIVRTLGDEEAEATFVGGWLRSQLEGGVRPEEIGVFVRAEEQLARARRAVRAGGRQALTLTDRPEEEAGRVAVGTMHLAKGLEFRAVAVMACDDDVLPLQARIEGRATSRSWTRSTTPSATCSTSPARGRGTGWR